MEMRSFHTSCGQTRRFGIVSPATSSGDLFLWLHGSTQSAAVGRRFTGCMFDAFADRGVTVLYPEGIFRHWNDARVHFPEKTRELGTNDVGFLRELIASFSPTRVFVAGFSNGGQMVFRLLHDAPGLVTKAAVIAASQPVADNFSATSTGWVKTPLLVMHGTCDPIVPFDGGLAALDQAKARGRVYSAIETEEYYRGLNADSQSVRLFVLEGVGHVVPGPSCVSSTLLGPACTTIDTAEVLAEFFGLGKN